jgi:hypothetical protein
MTERDPRECGVESCFLESSSLKGAVGHWTVGASMLGLEAWCSALAN